MFYKCLKDCKNLLVQFSQQQSVKRHLVNIGVKPLH